MTRQHEPDDSRIECPQPPEWIAKNAGNVVVGGGRMMKGTVQLKYRDHYGIAAELLAERDQADYGSAFSHFSATRYAYLLSQRATAGWRADTGGEGEAGGMPLADFYLALSKRFDRQSKARYSQGGGKSSHWDTLMMLLRPLPEGCNVPQVRSAIFVIFNDVATALELLEEFSDEIMKTWKRANAPSREDEERSR